MKGGWRVYYWVEMLDLKKVPSLAERKVDKMAFLLDDLKGFE